jgi:DNA-binding NtrC family response regulator
MFVSQGIFLFAEADGYAYNLATRAEALSRHKLGLVDSAPAALRFLSQNYTSLLVLDLNLPKLDLLKFFEQSKTAAPHLFILVVHDEKTEEKALLALEMGAQELLQKPFTLRHLSLMLAKTQENIKREQELKSYRENLSLENQILGQSPSMKTLLEKVQRVAKSAGRVLVYGEEGAGKELIARALHQQSPRKKGPLVTFSCRVIPPGQMEAALFGREESLEEGRHKGINGKLEDALGGTMVLDEVGYMPLPLQAKVLRVLQEEEFTRVGGSEPMKLDVRIIATTSQDIPRLVEKGYFREDLYHHLEVLPITLPPLRERKEDIPLLAEHFLKIACRAIRKKERALTLGAQELLKEYAWPSNVRELKNFIERLVITVEDDKILASHIAQQLPAAIKLPGKKMAELEGRQGLQEILMSWEKELITDYLEANNWNLAQTALDLKIERAQLQKKINQFDIKPKVKD